MLSPDSLRWHEHAGRFGRWLWFLAEWSWRHVLRLGGEFLRRWNWQLSWLVTSTILHRVSQLSAIAVHSCWSVFHLWLLADTGFRRQSGLGVGATPFGSGMSLNFARTMCCTAAWRHCWRATPRLTPAAVALLPLHRLPRRPRRPHQRLHPHRRHHPHQPHRLGSAPERESSLGCQQNTDACDSQMVLPSSTLSSKYGKIDQIKNSGGNHFRLCFWGPWMWWIGWYFHADWFYLLCYPVSCCFFLLFFLSFFLFFLSLSVSFFLFFSLSISLSLFRFDWGL